jgi:FKBP12-rapamycin complex-associated protein
MVPLICQGMMLHPTQTDLWTEGIKTMSQPKLHQAMTTTVSIWLPLLLTTLESRQPDALILAGLKLIKTMVETLEPMKTCLIKPLVALARERVISPPLWIELQWVVKTMDLPIPLNHGVTKLTQASHSLLCWCANRQEFPQMHIAPHEPIASAKPKTITDPRKQPILSAILHQNLPSTYQTVQGAWSTTLLGMPNGNGTLWLHNLFQATLEACGVEEMIIASRVSG